MARSYRRFPFISLRLEGFADQSAHTVLPAIERFPGSFSKLLAAGRTTHSLAEQAQQIDEQRERGWLNMAATGKQSWSSIR